MALKNKLAELKAVHRKDTGSRESAAAAMPHGAEAVRLISRCNDNTSHYGTPDGEAGAFRNVFYNQDILAIDTVRRHVKLV